LSSTENPAAVVQTQGLPAAAPIHQLELNLTSECASAESCAEKKDRVARRQFLAADRGVSFLCNLGWSGANQVTRAAAMTLVIIVVTRHLGPSAYGSLAFGLSIVKIGVIAAGLGLDRIIVQQLVLKPEATPNVLRGGLLYKALAGFVTYVAVISSVSVFLPNHEMVRFVVMIAGLGFLLQAFDTFNCLFQARGQMKLSFFGRTIPILIAAALKVGAVMAGATVLTFAALEAVEAALISAGLVIVCWKFGGLKELTTLKTQSSSPGMLLFGGLPLLISGVAVTIYLRSDLIMLGMMTGSKATGIYSAAAQVSEIWNVIPLTVAPAVFPLLLHVKQKGDKVYERSFLMLLQSISLGAILIACSVAVGAPLIVKILYGEAFANAVGVVRFHNWSVVFTFLGMTQTLWDAGERLYWLTCIRTVLGAISNVCLNLILIPKFGTSGAAIATVVSYAVAGFLLNAISRQTFPLFIMQLKSICMIPLIRWLWSHLRVSVGPSGFGLSSSKERNVP
jgi:PST family polysaccharide transporter